MTPHDDFFSSIMQHSHIAKDALKAYLPAKVSKKINWEKIKLQRIDTRSIDEKHNKTIADILFLTSEKTSKKPIYLLLHIEHFSSLPKEAILRTVQYQVSALLEYTKAHPDKLLPSPISLVYYHGKQNVKRKPTQMSDLFESKDFLTYFANPIFHDVTQIPDEELKTHGSMGGIDLLFKYIYAKPSKAILEKILPMLSKEPRQVHQYVVRYLLECWDIDPTVIKNIAMQHFDKRSVMTAAKQIEKQAIERLAKEMLRGKEPITKIRKYTGFSQQKIDALKKEIKAEKEVA